MTEILKKLFLGNWHDAQDKKFLQRNHISHVAIAAGELRPIFDDLYFYKQVKAANHQGFKLSEFFDEMADYIDLSIETGTGVLVHCD